ncbi:hypothetical protein BAUCODRAFT_248957 [Baudoinia panamericana UAMH 10762]|uniref:Uncharacterized protein n=1 Tax=Baudoinia panamericana (strain UAMH 10762) TaxID=717646 RepID=M2N3R0_BAUPA|nr:uncharacterized protein BAUCODRAFT_248957 [Baudoinia panamericana UAMH 10762]EMC93649.1 hypothetical protein BAUCODRAFT_248957 [Baudoinia panamericana UAMH 10762]
MAPATSKPANTKLTGHCAWKMRAGFAALGINLWKGGELLPLFDRSGLARVKQITRSMPTGPWPDDAYDKQIGTLWTDMTVNGLDALATRPLVEGLAMEGSEVERLIGEARVELREGRARHFMRL